MFRHFLVYKRLIYKFSLSCLKIFLMFFSIIGNKMHFAFWRIQNNKKVVACICHNIGDVINDYDIIDLKQKSVCQKI